MILLRTASIFISALFAVVLIFSPLSAVYAEVQYVDFDIDGENANVYGAMLPFEKMEMHIPSGVISEDAQVQIVEGKKIKKQKDLPQLPKAYRSNRPVYQYDIDSFENIDLDEIVVRIRYKGKAKKRHRVFYLAPDATEWKRLRTEITNTEPYAQVTLPSGRGSLVVATRKSGKERPIKQKHYSEYNGVPYSDTAAVLDVKSGKFLYREEAKKQRSIASVTKIATSLTFLNTGTDPSGTVTYSSDYDRIGADADVYSGNVLSKYDVLMGTLIRSANNLAVTLAHSTELSEDAFIAEMNATVADLGLKKTVFYEPTGLDEHNVSTAGNLAKLARHAFKKYPEVYETAGDSTGYTLTVQNTGAEVWLKSTNKFDGKGLYDLKAFKTGYLPGTADRTLVAYIEEIKTGHEIIVVLLGNPYYNTIFQEAYAVAEWTFNNWLFHNY